MTRCQFLLRGKAAAAVDIRSVGRQHPSRWIVDIEVENAIEHRTVLWDCNRNEQLHAAPEVPRAEIRRTDEVLGVAAVAEAIDARMLEKPADDRRHPNALAAPRHSRAQRAHAAHDEI